MKKVIVLGVLGCLSVCEGNGSDLTRINQRHQMQLNHNMQTSHAQKQMTKLEQSGLAQRQRAEKEKFDKMHAAERAKAAQKK